MNKYRFQRQIQFNLGNLWLKNNPRISSRAKYFKEDIASAFGLAMTNPASCL
jgi:hypothetical protein